jgi:hypothetical protein
MAKPSISIEKANQIRYLRERGNSIPEIHRLLKVSKSTVFRHCKNIQILPEYQQRWLDRRNASKIISDKAWEMAHKASADLLSSISDKELKILGAALYWAEGAKKQFNFINSDPDMIRLFMHILLYVFKVPVEFIKISIRLFEDISIPKAIEFWANITQIKLDNKTEINLIKGSKNGKLPYGMCRIRVKKGGLLLKNIFAINKRVISMVSDPV